MISSPSWHFESVLTLARFTRGFTIAREILIFGQRSLRYTKIFPNTFFPQSFRSRVPKGFRRCTSTTKEKGWTADLQIRPGDDLKRRIVPKKDCSWNWSFSYIKNVRASGEAILGTQRYFSKHFTLDNITVLLSSLNFRAKFLVANHTVSLFVLLQYK